MTDSKKAPVALGVAAGFLIQVSDEIAHGHVPEHAHLPATATVVVLTSAPSSMPGVLYGSTMLDRSYVAPADSKPLPHDGQVKPRPDEA